MKNMEKVDVTVELTDNNYAAYIEILPGCVSTGKTFLELQRNMRQALDFHLETSREFGDDIPVVFENAYELVFKFDPESLLMHYKGIFTNSAFERLTGINQRQLQRYAVGKSKPLPAQSKRITKALHDLGKELLMVKL